MRLTNLRFLKQGEYNRPIVSTVRVREHTSFVTMRICHVEKCSVCKGGVFFSCFSKYKTTQLSIARPPKICSRAKMVSIIMQTKINPQTPKQCQLVNSITSNQAYISSHSPSSSSFSSTGGSFLVKTLRSSGQVELSFSQGRMQSRSKR